MGKRVTRSGGITSLPDRGEEVYRYACVCGRYWWSPSYQLTRTCRKCQRVVRVHVQDGSYEGETQTVEDEVWHPTVVTEMEALSDNLANLVPRLEATRSKIDRIHFALDLSKMSEAQLLKMLRWFVYLLIAGAVNDTVIHSGVMSSGLSVAWLVWMYSMPLAVLTCFIQTAEPTRFINKSTSKPKSIEKRYLSGKIDADEYDTEIGATMGVIKDQERLRHLRELNK